MVWRGAFFFPLFAGFELGVEVVLVGQQEYHNKSPPNSPTLLIQVYMRRRFVVQFACESGRRCHGRLLEERAVRTRIYLGHWKSSGSWLVENSGHVHSTTAAGAATGTATTAAYAVQWGWSAARSDFQTHDDRLFLPLLDEVDEIISLAQHVAGGGTGCTSTKPYFLDQYALNGLLAFLTGA